MVFGDKSNSSIGSLRIGVSELPRRQECNLQGFKDSEPSVQVETDSEIDLLGLGIRIEDWTRICRFGSRINFHCDHVPESHGTAWCGFSHFQPIDTIPVRFQRGTDCSGKLDSRTQIFHESGFQHRCHKPRPPHIEPPPSSLPA
jgi:hypothetical protein